MIANLAKTLLRYEYIVTTLSRSKVLQSFVDHLVTIAKRDDDRAKRKLEALLQDKPTVEKLIKVYVERFKEKNSGFTHRIIIKQRKGDNATLAKIFMEGFVIKEKKIKPVKSKKKLTNTKMRQKNEKEQKRSSSVLDKLKDLRDRRRKEVDEKKGSSVKNVIEKTKAKSRSGI